MAPVKESIVLPTIVSPKLHKSTAIAGVVVGVVPHLDPTVSQVATIRDLAGDRAAIDVLKAQVPPALEKILKDDEVIYLVVGKWPPDGPRVSFATPAMQDSPVADRFKHALDLGVPINMVIGKWPPDITGSQEIQCPHCGHKFAG